MVTNRILVAVLLAVFGMSLSVAKAQTALSAQQQKLLTDATTALDQAEKIVKDIESSTKTMKAGDPGITVEKTQAMLADRDKAVQLMNTANTRFRQLPMAHPDVRAQAERVKPMRDTLVASDGILVNVHNALANTANQKSAPTQTPQRVDPSAPKLGYQQEQLLKDATSYLDQSEGLLQRLNDLTKNVKVGDANVQIQDVDSWISNKDRAAQYLTYADNRFKQLPSDHPSVKVEAARLEQLNTSISTLNTKLVDVRASLMKVVEKGSGQQYKSDFDRLKEINRMFANPRILEERPGEAVEIIKQIEPVRAERKGIAQRYADLLKQSTGEANQMNSVLKYFDEVFAAFEKSVADYSNSAPAAIDKDLAETIKLAEDGVANKRPAYFQEGNGVPQRLGWAETRYKVFAAINPESMEVAAAKKKIDSSRQQIARMQESLTESIVQANRPPSENYSGADKSQLIEQIKGKWATSGLTSPVLKMGINSLGGWQRETRWQWNTSNAWYKVDISRLQGFVIVKHNETTAAVYYINFVKDHMADDRVEAFFFDDLKEEPLVTHRILLANLK